MFSAKPDRPYLDAWLRRTSRRLAASGLLSQTATILAHENGGTPDEWRMRLRNLLDGEEMPSLDLLIRIDTLLMGPPPQPGPRDARRLPRPLAGAPGDHGLGPSPHRGADAAGVHIG